MSGPGGVRVKAPSGVRVKIRTEEEIGSISFTLPLSRIKKAMSDPNMTPALQVITGALLQELRKRKVEPLEIFDREDFFPSKKRGSRKKAP